MPSPPPPEEGKQSASTSTPPDGTTMKLDLSKSAYLNDFFKQIDTYVKLLVSNNLNYEQEPFYKHWNTIYPILKMETMSQKSRYVLSQTLRNQQHQQQQRNYVTLYHFYATTLPSKLPLKAATSSSPSLCYQYYQNHP